MLQFVYVIAPMKLMETTNPLVKDLPHAAMMSWYPKKCSESYPGRPVYWDNFKKKCQFKSRTCDQKYTFD